MSVKIRPISSLVYATVKIQMNSKGVDSGMFVTIKLSRLERLILDNEKFFLVGESREIILS
jgi:hypothetical protein